MSNQEIVEALRNGLSKSSTRIMNFEFSMKNIFYGYDRLKPNIDTIIRCSEINYIGNSSDLAATAYKNIKQDYNSRKLSDELKSFCDRYFLGKLSLNDQSY